MKKTCKSLSLGNLLHNLHNNLVVVYCHICRIINSSQLMLCRSHFIVLCLCSNAEFPQLNIQIMHKRANTLSNSSKIMVIKLLTFWSRCAKQGSSCINKVLSGKKIISVHKKIFLLWSYACCNLGCFCVAKQPYNTKRLLADRFHGAEQRSLFIKRLSCIRAESSRNTKNNSCRTFCQKYR